MRNDYEGNYDWLPFEAFARSYPAHRTICFGDVWYPVEREWEKYCWLSCPSLEYLSKNPLTLHYGD
jgi:hypothetical protein